MIPGQDRRLLAVVSEHGDGSGAEGDRRTEPRGLPEEHGGQDPQVVAVRDEGDVAVHHRRQHPREHARRAGGDLFDRLAGSLAADHPVPEGRPVIAELGPNILRGATLVPAVIPFDQQRINVGLQPRQLGCAACALERGREHEPEIVVAHQFARGSRQILAVRGQRDVREPGVPSRPRPLGLAMPQQHELALRVVRGGLVGQRVGWVHRDTLSAGRVRS